MTLFDVLKIHNFFAQGASASVVGGKHRTTARYFFAQMEDQQWRKSNIVTPLGNTEIEINLKIKKFDTTKEGLLYYKNRVDDVLNK